MLGDQIIGHDPSMQEMLMDDLLEHGRIAVPVPGTLGIDDRNGSALAYAQAIRFRAQDPALLRQPQFFEPLLQELPRFESAFLLAALRFRLIAAEKDMPARHRDADAVRLGPLGFSNGLHTQSSSASHVNPS